MLDLHVRKISQKLWWWGWWYDEDDDDIGDVKSRSDDEDRGSDSFGL